MPSDRTKISYVIASRNDGYCGDAMGRLHKTIEHIQVEQNNDNSFEVVMVDWGSKEPIKFHVATGRLRRNVRLLHVPPSLATPHFHETLALNLGIRRARGEWIARLDQDTLVGPRFVEWFRSGMPTAIEGAVIRYRQQAFFSLRRDLPEDLIWQSWDKSGEPYWRGAVGMLLATRDAWHNVRGYFEGMDRRNHIEHDLALRLARECGLSALGPLTNYDFHHQHHPRPSGLPQNPFRSEQVLLQMIEEGKFTNPENWGLKDQWDQIKEVVL